MNQNKNKDESSIGAVQKINKGEKGLIDRQIDGYIDRQIEGFVHIDIYTIYTCNIQMIIYVLLIDRQIEE